MLLRANALAKGVLGHAGRGRGAPARVPEPRRASAGAEPRLGRRERRSRAARASRAAARRRGRGVGRRGAAAGRRGAAPRRARAVWASRRRRGSRSSTARSSWPRSARSALVRARRLAKAADIACALTVEALQGSRESFRPEIHALRPLRGQAASRPRTSSGSSRARRSSSRTAGATSVQDAYSLRCAPQVHGACRDLLALRRGDRRRRAERRDRQSARLRRAAASSSRTATSTGSRSRSRSTRWRWRVAELASISERRDRAARQPEPLGGPARLPRRRRRAQLGLHDPPVRGGVARQREQGALPPGERRLDPDERRPGGSRLDGERVRVSRPGRCSRTPSGARDRAAGRRAGRRVPGAARPGAGVRAAQRLRPGALADASSRTGRSQPTSSSLRRAIRERLSSSTRSEAEVGELA